MNKKNIINVLVIIAMSIIANYPMYNNLRTTAHDMNKIIATVQNEVSAWKDEIELMQGRIEGVRVELTDNINSGIAKTDTLLNKIKSIEKDISKKGASLERAFKVLQ